MKIRIVVLAISISLSSACKKEASSPDTGVKTEFFVRTNGADLPVLVKGNSNSRAFILYVHGGPETGAIAESTDPVFWGSLEKKYKMVYYDQRGIGMSNGAFDESSLTIGQYVEDLNKIIDVLKNKYGKDISLFLLGGSWGGYLGTAYISTADYQKKLKGWIEIGGAHNMQLIGQESPKHIKQTAEQQIRKGVAKDKWQKHLDYANSYDITDRSFENWLSLIQQYTPITDQLQSDGELTFRAVDIKIPTSINLLTLWSNDNLNQTGIKILKKYYNTTLTPGLVNVTLPCRFFWGEYDFASAPALAYDAYNHIGTPIQDKQVKIFKNAEHTILLTKPEELLEEIYSFIDLYK